MPSTSLHTERASCADAALTATRDPESDPREFRSALGAFATGVTIVSARGSGGRPVGVTANSFTSVSLNPPLVLWSLSKRAHSLPAFEQAEHFVVHVLGADQSDLASRFALRGAGDKFADTEWYPGAGGAPVLTGVAAHFECTRHAAHDGGDHRIYVGRVLGYRAAPAAHPLAFHAGRFATCIALDPARTR
jgi:flavin reductase (DIM6/NTAB) family NADH-FMN oxidoreductase RutF